MTGALEVHFATFGPAPTQVALTSLCHAGEHLGAAIGTMERTMELQPGFNREWAQALQGSVFPSSPTVMGSLQASISAMPLPG